MKIGYFADGPWSHLALEKIVQDGRFELAFIVPRFDTQDPILAAWAERLAIDFLPLQDVNATASLETLARYEADIFVSMSFNQILKRPIIDLAPQGFINCHAGALPYYRGRNILNWALINDANEFGVTVHYVDEGIDTGDIIAQTRSPICDSDTYATLLARAITLCADTLHAALSEIAADNVQVKPQANIHPVGFYCGRRVQGDEWIDWNWPSRRVFNFVRGIATPGPGARTLLNGHELIVGKSEIIPNALDYIGTPGEIVGVKNNAIVVKTGDSTILLVDVLPPPGIRFRIGQRLGLNYSSIMRDLLRRIELLEQLLSDGKNVPSEQ
jgi:methionyl-tRNA formyltransferase